LPVPHWALLAHSGWQTALMQRVAVPQSVSNTHCAVAWRAGVAQVPAVHSSPMPQLALVVQVAWHLPPLHTRPEPHCTFTVQSTSAESPQVGPL
jgi:hypothetical protein